MDWGGKRDFIAGFFSTAVFLILLVSYLPEVTELTRKIHATFFYLFVQVINQRVRRIGE